MRLENRHILKVSEACMRGSSAVQRTQEALAILNGRSAGGGEICLFVQAPSTQQT